MKSCKFGWFLTLTPLVKLPCSTLHDLICECSLTSFVNLSNNLIVLQFLEFENVFILLIHQNPTYNDPNVLIVSYSNGPVFRWLLNSALKKFILKKHPNAILVFWSQFNIWFTVFLVFSIWVSSIQISAINSNEAKGLRKKYYWCGGGLLARADAMAGIVVLASNMARASAIRPCWTALIRLPKTSSGSSSTGLGVGTTWNKKRQSLIPL